MFDDTGVHHGQGNCTLQLVVSLDVLIFKWYTSVLIKGGFGKYRLYDMKLMLPMKEE